MSIFLILLAAGESKRLKSTKPKPYISVNNKTLIECEPGKENTCGKRFDWKLGDLPEGYDHKYIYSHAGYNMKITDMQAACGLAQINRVKKFIKSRKSNFKYIYNSLKSHEEFLILPEATENSDPSWFGFPITLRDNLSVTRNQLLRHLDEKII